MDVILLNHASGLETHNLTATTHNYEHLAGVAAAICVDKFDWGTDDYTSNMQSALASGHLSIIEHLPLTFLVKDVTRALTHQLVRHRIASYSQQSQRYAKVNTKEDWYILPESILNKDEEINIKYKNYRSSIYSEYERMMSDIADFYNLMIENDVPKEDARMILPNACFTTIIVTMNARAFIEAGSKRICNKAQWEIRNMFRKMRKSIKYIYPTVYEMTKPNCQKNGCAEKYPCKNPYEE
jgi:thymidylate synthase (FAD)